MTRQEMVAAVEAEIGRLEQVRELLQRSNSDRIVALAGTAKGAREEQKRTMSAEGRRRIALAQKRRWAKQKRELAASSDARK
ncbi:MAG TPA: hypothetical protein VGD62_02865 [Acidobacteriaceae bacterium]